MTKKFFGFLLYHICGWQLDVDVPLREKSLFCIAPHTSNWDFIISILYRKSLGFQSFFLMKKDWFFWPLGPILRALDGIPIDRSHHSHLTDDLAQTMLRKKGSVHMAITPEGTRSATRHWKRGFYFIALKAQLPIQLYAIDYAHKTIICHKEILPTGDIERDFREIVAYYTAYREGALYPEKFQLDEIADQVVSSSETSHLAQNGGENQNN